MSDSMKRFLELLVKDESLQNGLKEAKSPEAAFSVAKEVVKDLEQSDFAETMTRIRDLTEKQHSGELSEDDLDLVAGGWSNEETAAAVIMGLSFIGGLAATAAI